MENKKFIQPVLLGSIFFLLLFVTIGVPAAELITIFLLPVPVVMYTVRFGTKAASLFFAILLVISLLFIMEVSFPLTLLTGLGGLMIGNAIEKKLSPYETLARGTAGFVLGMLGIFLFVQVLFGINIINELHQTMEKSIETSQQMMQSFGIQQFTSEEMSQIRDELTQIINLLPFILVMMALVIAFITQWISYKILNKRDNKRLKFPPFRNYQLPKIMLWIYLITIILSSFDYETSSMMYQVVTNVMNLTGVLIAVQGLSFILYYTHIKKSNKAIPVIIIIFTILFLPVGLYLTRILGIIDLGFSLRERLGKK